MKTIIVYTLALTALFAQQPDYNDMANQMYAKMQENIVPKTKKMLQNLKVARKCLKNAKNKKEATICFKTVQKQADEIEKKIAGAYGIAQGQDEKELYKDEDFKWDKKTKKETIKELDYGIKQSSATIKCFETSADFQKFGICTQQAGIE